MAAEDAASSTSWGLIGGLVAALLVAVFSTLLSAEASRREALRQERRSAYAALLGAVSACEHNALIVPLLARLDTVVNTGGDSGFVDSVRKLSESLNSCSTAVGSHVALVRLLSNNVALDRAAGELKSATIGLTTANLEANISKRDELYDRYFRATAAFQVFAKESANERVVSSFTIFIVAQCSLAIGTVVLVFWGWRRTGRVRTRSVAP